MNAKGNAPGASPAHVQPEAGSSDSASTVPQKTLLGNSLLDAALEYRAHGWSVIPIGADKKPYRGMSWARYQESAAKERTVQAWFKAPHESGVIGVGIVCGAVSGGLVVRDFDNRDAYKEWAAAHPNLTKVLPTVITARGFHVYARCETPVGLHPYRDGSGELRGEGAYIIAPPSIHPTGFVYTWDVPLRETLPVVDGYAVFDCPRPAPLVTGTVSVAPAVEAPTLAKDSVPPLEGVEPVKDYIARAIADTVPAGPGLRQKAIFKYARRLKTHPVLAGIPQNDSHLVELARQWFKAAEPFIGTKDVAITIEDFMSAWERAWSEEAGVFSDALRCARESTDTPEAARGMGERVELLARLCLALADEKGEFFLSGKKWAGVVEISERAAWKHLRLLERIGLIQALNREGRTRQEALAYRVHHAGTCN